MFNILSIEGNKELNWIELKTRGYATRENIAFYDHSWNKILSYTNIQQISSIYFLFGRLLPLSLMQNLYIAEFDTKYLLCLNCFQNP